MVLLILDSDRLGTGDDALGSKLMASFLSTLADSGHPVHHVVCLNAGVFLTTSEGPALDALRRLEESGARVASCGTCLGHFERKGRLLVGRVGTMGETVELLVQAERVLRP